MKRTLILMIWFIFVLLFTSVVVAQESDELAATLEVLSPGVEVLRADTVNWVSIKIEAIIAFGDIIRTDETGRARVTFFSDGVDTELLPNTEYKIEHFRGDSESFSIEVQVIAGETVQRLTKLLDSTSNYNIITPGMELVARGTQFAIRVEGSGRSAMLVSEGAVDASAQSQAANVPPGFGVRANAQETLSDVVAAATFEQLDAALDGCSVVVTTTDDVSLNVRSGPATTFEQIGTITAIELIRFFGKTESGNWYRIPFQGDFAWVLSSTAEVDENCAGLRLFPDDYDPESAVDEPPGELTPEATTTP